MDSGNDDDKPSSNPTFNVENYDGNIVSKTARERNIWRMNETNLYSRESC